MSTSTHLRHQSILLHRELLDQLLLHCQNTNQETDKKLAGAVHIAHEFLQKLYALVPDYFEDGQEELLFFKSVKPLFVAEREYHQRLYHAALFSEGDPGFYGMEQTRMGRLLSDHADFVNYYHRGETGHDHQWFVQGQAPEPTNLCMHPWETVPKYTSRRDGWVGGLLAVERYRDWLKTKQSEQMALAGMIT